MKYQELRNYMKNKQFKKYHVLHDCSLVIDGNCYFKESYRMSGCHFLYGSECDRYAEFLKNKLQWFIDNKVTCYVIFSGCTKAPVKKRREAHQKIIEDRQDIDYELRTPHFEPTLAKEVQREILEILGIKYFYCEYDSMEAIVSVARKFKCPILTNCIEYCLYGVSCIRPNSVVAYKDQIVCDLYDHADARAAFGVYNKTPLLITLLNENGVYFEKLADIIECDDNSNRRVASTIRWVKKNSKGSISNVLSKLNTEVEKKAFQEVYVRIDLLFSFSPGTLAVKHFQRRDAYGIFKDDKKWFSKAVSNARIAVSYVDLKKRGIFTGSQAMFDVNKPDAVLASVDIISYCHQILTNSMKSEFTFIGRQLDSSAAWEIVTSRNTKVSKLSIFTDRKNCNKKKPNPFDVFLCEKLPGFKLDHLLNIPMECRSLVLSLIYYTICINKDFVFGAYCVILSYVMLGPVAKPDDYLKMFFDPSLAPKDCQMFDKELSVFKRNSVRRLDLGLIHILAEFEHCLQHINNLFKLCTKNASARKQFGTSYHKTYNGTLAYNLFMAMKNENNLMKFLENRFKASSVLEFYKNIVECFQTCLEKCKGTEKTQQITNLTPLG